MSMNLSIGHWFRGYESQKQGLGDWLVEFDEIKVFMTFLWLNWVVSAIGKIRSAVVLFRCTLQIQQDFRMNVVEVVI